MTKIFTNREFLDFYNGSSKKLFQDCEFNRCHFINCAVSSTTKPKRRSTARNIIFRQCEVTGCLIDTVIAEDILIDGLKINGSIESWAAVFKHVIFRGNIGKMMISPLVATGMAKPEEQAAFDEANAAYYQTVDWALDISEARFVECDIRNVPAASSAVTRTARWWLPGKKHYWASGKSSICQTPIGIRQLNIC